MILYYGGCQKEWALRRGRAWRGVGDEAKARRKILIVTPKPLGGESVDEGGWGCDEGLENIPALFSRGGYDGSDASEGACARHGSETAGEFHLDLHHSQVPLASLLVKGTAKS